MTEVLQSERYGGFDALVLASDANRNALSLQLLSQIAQSVEVSAAGDSRGIVLSHTGTTFCSGVDLRERRALGPDDDSHSRLLGELFLALWNYPKPLVIAVDGAVRGGGMGMLACADVVIASADSTFAYSEVRVGVAPALVMAVTLPVIAQPGILPLLLSGDTFGTDVAHRLGLVTAIDDAPRSTGLREAVARLTAAAPRAQARTKALFRAAHEIDMAAAIRASTRESAALFISAEAIEGMASFADRRPPSWSVTSRSSTGSTATGND